MRVLVLRCTVLHASLHRAGHFAAGCRHIHGASANRELVGDSLADAATTTRDKGNSAVEISIVSIAHHMISVLDRGENKSG